MMRQPVFPERIPRCYVPPLGRCDPPYKQGFAMTDLPPAHAIVHPKPGDKRHGFVTLGYDERFLRRKRLVTEDDEGFVVDLAETVSVGPGDCFVLDDGRLIEVVPAQERVLVVTGDLPRLAWHIGNRHTPCQIEHDRLLIRDDHVLEAMLRQLGATVAADIAPFAPEGGAYGHGRTMGHDHAPLHEPVAEHVHVHHHSSHVHPDDDTEAEPE